MEYFFPVWQDNYDTSSKFLSKVHTLSVVMVKGMNKSKVGRFSSETAVEICRVPSFLSIWPGWAHPSRPSPHPGGGGGTSALSRCFTWVSNMQSMPGVPGSNHLFLNSLFTPYNHQPLGHLAFPFYNPPLFWKDPTLNHLSF